MLPANGFNAERRRQGMDFHLPFEGPYFFIGAEPLTIHMVRTGRGSTVKERGHSLFIW